MEQPKNFDSSYIEKLAVRLSVPRQNTYNALPVMKRPAVLPINALPGWESIPLHSKLPMLKCPDNQVIFSKNQIGKTFKTMQGDFDAVCRNVKMEYNPLHDPHLRRFYSNEKLLKRLRDNGEITENNDVICTLKEFNEHRILSHEIYLSRIRIERNKLNDEKANKHMINHAEQIAERERRIREKSYRGGGYADDVTLRKAELMKQRQLLVQRLRTREQQKDEQVEKAKAIQQFAWDHKKEVHKFMFQRRLDAGLDIRRKRLIALRKHLQFKADRLTKHMKVFKENANKAAKEKARQSWEAHLQERISKHERSKKIIKENERSMREWVESHLKKYQRKWNEMQTRLEARSGHHTKRHSKRKSLAEKFHLDLEKGDGDQLKNLTSEDIQDALHTAIDMSNLSTSKNTDPDADNYIYKAAKYILEDILGKFSKDLSGEPYLEALLANRISRLIIEVKQYVIKRATQIIRNLENIGYLNGPCRRPSAKRFSTSSPSKRFSMLKLVSFSSYSALIGKGSYVVIGDDLKETAERFPTPAGSLTSVVIELSDDEEPSNIPRKSFHHLTREEEIFIEHLFIKFKRELIVGIGRQVLAAIECHRKNKILNVRTELQDITKEFLVKLMARSILSYAANSCNFHSNSLLCQCALAGDIILYLQQNLLKPERDPRHIVQPRSRCTCPVPPPFAKYCKRRFQ